MIDEETLDEEIVEEPYAEPPEPVVDAEEEPPKPSFQIKYGIHRKLTNKEQ